MRILAWLFRVANNIQTVLALTISTGVAGVVVSLIGRIIDLSGPLGLLMGGGLFLIVMAASVPVSATGVAWALDHTSRLEKGRLLEDPASRFEQTVQDCLDEIDVVTSAIPRDPAIGAREVEGHVARINAAMRNIERDLRKGCGLYASKLFALDRRPEWPRLPRAQNCATLVKWCDDRRVDIEAVRAEYPVTKKKFVRIWISVLIQSANELRPVFELPESEENHGIQMQARFGLGEWENDARILIERETPEFGHFFSPLDLSTLTPTETVAHIDRRSNELQEMWRQV